MTLFLDERAVAQLVTMPDALSAVEEVFLESGKGNVTNVSRVRAPLKDGILRITAGILTYRGYYGIKISSTTVFGRNAGRIFCLYKEDGGELCAIIQVFGMGALRTGAASGVATKYLANPHAAVLGVIGAGRQARTQVEAIAQVRPLREVRVFSQTKQRQAQFCQDLVDRMGIPVQTAASAEEAVRHSDVVVTATTATSPVLLGQWLRPGTHINAIGANYEHRRELDSEAVTRCATIVTDDQEQVRYESTDLGAPVKEGLLHWNQVRGLGELVAGRIPGRTATSDITLFKSLGVAIEDVALAIVAYEKALKRGVGQKLPDIAG